MLEGTELHIEWTSLDLRLVRLVCSCYDHVPAGERPTFHEIRALGVWPYEQQNFPQEYIQALQGHSDEKMTSTIRRDTATRRSTMLR